MQKLKIKNRKDQEVSVLIENEDSQRGLVFVMHGLGGFKEQDHIRVFAEAFVENGMTAVRFDATNASGESDGSYEDATVTNYYEDLEDVIKWAEAQSWYQEPFYLIGHSLGGFSTAFFAERYPDKVKGLAPISPMVSGKLSEDAHKEFDLESYEEWKKTGWWVTESKSKPGVIKRLKWSHMEDRLQYDLLPQAQLLTMPVLLITGEKDFVTPAKHVEEFFKVIPGEEKTHTIIQGASHTFRKAEHLDEIKKLIVDWIVSVENK